MAIVARFCCKILPVSVEIFQQSGAVTLNTMKQNHYLRN